MDSAALTALVDRWLPKTHTFHLPCGETTVMLHDVIIILGLPIDGTPVCGMVSSTGWRDSVGEAICIRPPPQHARRSDKKAIGVHFGWLTSNFNTCPKGAEDAVVQRYILFCVWHMDDE
jgi:hypothetical protein